MPKDTSIKSILIIGSGPIQIGQACEFDYSGTQAVRALKHEGYRVILANSNPATIMTDPEFADQIYIEPLTPEFLEMILEKEKPDALLPTMGGQTALNLAVTLAEKGILKKHNVRLLGASLESIKLAEDRELFKNKMIELGIGCAKSELVKTMEEGRAALKTIGLPMILRPSFTMGGEGGGLVETVEEYEKLLHKGLFLSPVGSVLVEESLIGWKEFELEVVRDKKDNVIIVCSIENVDPMGIHTGDSMTVAPAQTLTDRQYQELRDYSKKIIRAIGVETGGSNIQYSINPADGRVIVIEMNPRVSRSSALASKATGFPIAKVAAKLAVGYTLDELTNEITGTTPASFEPSIDYVVTKIPRFDFEKFLATPAMLGTQMKSVGEAMAIGRTFKESLLKALSSMENVRYWFRHTEFEDPSTPISGLEAMLKKTHPHRIHYVATAMRRGMSISKIYDITRIDNWFLDQIKEILDLEAHFKKAGSIKKWSDREVLVAKQTGFSDRYLSLLTGEAENVIREERRKRGITPSFSLVDTCAGEFEAKTPYLYSTYCSKVASPPPAKNAVMIFGGGPNRIGQGIEFDYCCVHASMAVREMGYESIMINCNPETVSTDYDISSKLYFEPLTTEHVYEIFKAEPNVKGAIVQFGGQTPLKLAYALNELGIPILGTSVDSIDMAEDRKRFEKVIADLEPLGLKQPPNRTAFSAEEAVAAADEMGYPVLLRPSYVLGGRGMRVVFSRENLMRYIHEAIEVSDSKPVLIDRYLAEATELDVDAISDGDQVLIGGIMEHIEEAGIHSGDSACSLPPFTLGTEVTTRIRDFTRLLAKKLNVIGLMNVQYAVKDDEVYILEVNPRGSRTIPYVSKTIGVPLAKLATQIMLGKKLRDMGYTEDFDLGLKKFSVKMPVFPFHKFPGVDVLLGPEMKSTGEVMGVGKNFSTAYAKALLGAQIKIPLKGRALISVADEDKKGLIDIANLLVDLGFSIEATTGTHAYLGKYRIKSELVPKGGHGTGNSSKDCVQRAADGHYQLIINTVNDEIAIQDSFSIRRTALDKKIPYCTLITTARAFVRAMTMMKTQKFTLDPLK